MGTQPWRVSPNKKMSLSKLSSPPQTLEGTLLHRRACPPSLKRGSRRWRPHLSSIRLPEANVPPNQVPSQDHPSPLLSSAGWASNTWLCAGRDCKLRSQSHTGPHLPRPGEPSSRQRLASGRRGPICRPATPPRCGHAPLRSGLAGFEKYDTPRSWAAQPRPAFSPPPSPASNPG